MKDINLLNVKYIYTGKDITINVKNKKIMIDNLILEKIKEIGKILADKIEEEK